MFRSFHTFALLLALSPALVQAQEAASPAIPTVEVRALRTAQPPSIDGHLSEETWGAATPVSGFIQRDPEEGKPATEDTEVRILYDDTAVYIGARLFDDDPAGLSRRLSARDNGFDA